MVDKTYASLFELLIIALAVLIARYFLSVTHSSRIICGAIVLGIIGLYAYILVGVDSPLQYLGQFAMFFENEVITGYGKYITTLIFSICLLNSVGFGKKG